MAASVNKVILVGNLGRDPEIRSFQNGGRVANLSVATSESWTDKPTGARKERTEWHRVAVFDDRLVEVVEKYARKGGKLYLEGQIETRKYTDQSGAEKTTTEVVLRPFRGQLQLLDSAPEPDRPEPDRPEPDRVPPQQQAPARPPAAAPRAAAQPARRPPPLIEDDIPF